MCGRFGSCLWALFTIQQTDKFGHSPILAILLRGIPLPGACWPLARPLSPVPPVILPRSLRAPPPSPPSRRAGPGKHDHWAAVLLRETFPNSRPNPGDWMLRRPWRIEEVFFLLHTLRLRLSDPRPAITFPTLSSVRHPSEIGIKSPDQIRSTLERSEQSIRLGRKTGKRLWFYRRSGQVSV
jgi:hypothetical protein